MEVHRHAPPVKRRWDHYLWEFFMLFLAVFCGFLAEWQLERTIEHHREKQFIRSLTEDLKRDDQQLQLYRAFTENILTYCDSVQYCIANADIFRNSNSFYTYSRELARYNRYYPTDRTIQQLKNAGNMRLIRDWEVSNAIIDYDSKTRSLLEIDNELNEQIIKYREYIIEFMDLSSYDQLNPRGSFMDDNILTRGNPGYIVNDLKKVKVIYNQVFSIKIFTSTVKRSVEEVALNRKQLLALLQTEYHIRD